MSKRLVFFNHKGGVSKTTSAFNIGWMLAKTYQVLLVDGDPQCNLSGLILGDEFERYYFDETTRKQNIKDGVAPAFSGKPAPIQPITCPQPPRSPNLYLLPGHANLSEYDAALTFAQTANNAITTSQNLPGAFAELLRLTEEKYNIDYTIIDLNPGLSAINENLFLISNVFLVPTNPDPFSLMAIETLKIVLPRWTAWKMEAINVFADSAYPLPKGRPKFVGTLIQRFNIRRGRAATPYHDNINEIKDATRTSLVTALRNAGMMLEENCYSDSFQENGYCLAEIPDFQGLLPKARDAGVPIFELDDDEMDETGKVFNQLIDKREYFKNEFSEIINKLVELMSHA